VGRCGAGVDLQDRQGRARRRVVGAGIGGAGLDVGDHVDTDQIIPAEYLSYNPADAEERKFFGQHAMSGVPIEQLAGRLSFEEVAHLLITGSHPDRDREAFRPFRERLHQSLNYRTPAEVHLV